MPRGDLRPGEMTLDMSSEFRKAAPTGQQVRRQRIPPEMRFRRKVNLEDDGGENSTYIRMWNRYVNTIGDKNEGKGAARALGSMAVTYVKAVEMTRMMQKKFPNWFVSDRVDNRKLLQAYRSIKGEFSDYVGARDREIAEAQGMAVNLEISPEDYERNAKLWGVATIELSPQPASFGKCDLAVVPTHSDRGVLVEEMHDVWQFLRHQGLDTSAIDKSRAPHLSVFDSYHPLASVALRGAEIPQYIGLLAPGAYVADNSPGIPQ